MIDTLTLQGPLGPYQPSQLKHLTRMTIEQYFTAKSNTIKTYVDSPLTGAQIEVSYHCAMGSAYLKVKLPLASAAVGHNYIHAGAEHVDLEIDAANLLCRFVLTALEFSTAEISRWLGCAQVIEAELTWHTATTGRSAARKLLKKCEAAFEAMEQNSSRHDVPVCDVDCRKKNGAQGMLVTFKSGDSFRQYIKVEQIEARDRAHRKRNPGIKGYLDLPAIKAQIEGHVRNEAILCAKTLEKLGLDDPRRWNQQTAEHAIQTFWASNVAQTVWIAEDELAAVIAKKSPEVQETYARWKSGESPRSFLTASQLTRHRQTILTSTGRDIDLSPQQQNTQGRWAKQIDYARREEPRNDIRDFVLSEHTTPSIIAELRAGIDLFTDGTVPEQAHVPWGPIDWLKVAGRYRSGRASNTAVESPSFASRALSEAGSTKPRVSVRKARGIDTVPVRVGQKPMRLEVNGQVMQA
ncbi:hypothetical protein Q9Q94_06165 [Uliginosibacterium sp. 31-16]|uniref:hypothetical protein n=1 Tax=Uliginosibacterium sp. 31-16 TaxID=3068315 RepID=UPI00273D97D8|nr:hypothetical protein [Uliginosibacterium sp. 31-16]MDP5239107.1 hypothetical protein [Uliginosibacterium sp. 31-16]